MKGSETSAIREYPGLSATPTKAKPFNFLKIKFWDIPQKPNIYLFFTNLENIKIGKLNRKNPPKTQNNLNFRNFRKKFAGGT